MSVPGLSFASWLAYIRHARVKYFCRPFNSAPKIRILLFLNKGDSIPPHTAGMARESATFQTDARGRNPVIMKWAFDRTPADRGRASEIRGHK